MPILRAVVMVIHICLSTCMEYWNLDTYGKEWVVFVDYKGDPHYVSLEESAADTAMLRSVTFLSAADEPKFWLYSRDTINNPEELIKLSENSTHFKEKTRLVVIVGGWLSTRDGDSTQLIKNAFLTESKVIIKVIIMDWIKMQSWNYITSARDTMLAAKYLKTFIEHLVNVYKLEESEIHFVGHSLGAHVVGIAGGKLKENNITVSRVTGLDPARPFFEVPKMFPGISKDSAPFVDIIHTSVGILGMGSPVGHADFYPGGGKHQPAFCPVTEYIGSCEHSTAYIYFEKSLDLKFEARKCEDYVTFLTGSCNNNELQYMGSPCDRSARGSYFLDIPTLLT